MSDDAEFWKEAQDAEQWMAEHDRRMREHDADIEYQRQRVELIGKGNYHLFLRELMREFNITWDEIRSIDERQLDQLADALLHERRESPPESIPPEYQTKPSPKGYAAKKWRPDLSPNRALQSLNKAMASGEVAFIKVSPQRFIFDNRQIRMK